jgi:Fe-S-cluster containining protein
MMDDVTAELKTSVQMTANEIRSQICVQCGHCCNGLPDGPLMSSAEAGKLVTDLKVSGRLYDIVDTISLFAAKNDENRCPCLGCKDGNYICTIYEQRPQMCRDFICPTMEAVTQWLTSGGLWCDDHNPFKGIKNVVDLMTAAIIRTPGVKERGIAARENFQPRFYRRLVAAE